MSANEKLLEAIGRRDYVAAEHALDADADPNLAPGTIPLLCSAAVCGEIPLVELLVKYRANPNVIDSRGCSAVFFAATFCPPDHAVAVLEALYKGGADIGLRCADGRNALDVAVAVHQSVGVPNTAAVRWLTEHNVRGSRATMTAVRKQLSAGRSTGR